MPTDNFNGSCTPTEDRCCNNSSFLGCNSEILFFIIIFLLLFTNFGCGCNR